MDTKMQAVVVDPGAAGHLTLQAVDIPSPKSNEALVRVAATSLNLGEVRRAQGAEAGTRLGWDVAGTVERAAADGSGPRQGARVVGLVSFGGWAELVAVPTNALAEIPEGVSFAQAATLPVAGLTALLAVEHGTGLLARRVLVTGASGGVGHLACQLAQLSGATVVGLIRHVEKEAVVRDAGADEVVVSESAAPSAQFGPYRLVVESVGGVVLAQTLGMLAPDGVCVSFGATSGAEVTFNLWSLVSAGRASLYGLVLFNELAREPASVGLARLTQLVAEDRLRPHIDIEAPWSQIGRVAEDLLQRRLSGKAVISIP